jgi:predicted secreted protein
MNPVTGVVVFIIIWWLILFMVLPWGISRTENPEAGHDPGAPARPMVVRKLLITTGLTIVLLGLFMAVVGSGDVSLQDLSERYRL